MKLKRHDLHRRSTGCCLASHLSLEMKLCTDFPADALIVLVQKIGYLFEAIWAKKPLDNNCRSLYRQTKYGTNLKGKKIYALQSLIKVMILFAIKM